MSETTLEQYKKLVGVQSLALLEVIQAVGRGELELEVEIPEGIEALSDLASGIKEMIDHVREMLAEQERTTAEIKRAQQQLVAAFTEMQAVQRRYMQQEWEDYATAQGSQGYLLEGGEERPTKQAWLPAMTTAVQQVGPVTASDEQEGSTLAIPIHLYGQVVGIMGFGRRSTQAHADPAGEEWSLEEITAAEAIIEQVGWALENQRLFDKAQRASHLMGERVRELNCLNDIGRKIDEAPPVPEFLAWVAQRIPPAMRYPDVCLAAIEVAGLLYGAAEAVKLPRQIVGGLHVSGERVGKVIIAYSEDHDFIDEESALLGDILRRVSGYIERVRLLEEATRRAQREHILRQITARVRGSTHPDTIVRAAVRELGTALGRPTFVRLGSAAQLRVANPEGGE